jgi:hypothetical protein
VPVFKLEAAEDGTWLADIRLSGANWKPGDRIYRGGGDTLEVVCVRHDDERDVLVVRSVHV